MAQTTIAVQEQASAMKYGRRVLNIALIVASGSMLAASAAYAAEPPPGLLHKIAERESANAEAMSNYTYRQSVTLEEINDHGVVTGEYHEVRDVTFSPKHVRYEQVEGQPRNTLTHIKMTPVDFEDIRNVEPFLLTKDKASLYEGQYKGEETVNGELCFLEYVRPKQILSGQRFFEGLLWVRESDFSVVKSEGQGVPQIEKLREQNLTPHFTTFRKNIDGQWFFPVETYADDTLYFREWPQRIRIEIRYMDYKKFGAESTIIFGATGEQPQAQTPPPTAPPH